MSDRPLFDPARIRPPARPVETGPSLLSVRQVTELVRGALLQHLPATLHVLGEIGDLSRPASGHWYFTLKDGASELPCVMWRSAAARVKFVPQIGMEIIASGGIDVYQPRGVYQLYVSRIEPRGVGALELAFRQLKEKLEAAGLFDPARKRPLPRIPQRVALVTSPSGAAIRDILQTLRRRFVPLEIFIFPVRVQGEGAAREIATAIELMNRHAAALGGIDVAIVGRGGGSLEDLWAFNEEIVARAIAASRVPIVSAVGHEVDISISDLVADVRAATPTAAAELIAPRSDELIEWLAQRTRRAHRAACHALALSRGRLETLLAREPLARPRAALRQRAQQLDERQHRLNVALLCRVRDAHQRVSRAELAVLRFRAGAHFQRLAQRVAERLERARRTLAGVLLSRERQVAHILGRLQRGAPDRRIARFDEHLRQATQRGALALRALLRLRRGKLDARLATLSAYNPAQVLQRGYSLTRDAKTRRIIRSTHEIQDGQRLITELADGEFRSTADDPRQPRLFD